MSSAFWWRRPDLGYENGRLHLAGRDVAHLAAQADGPVFLYSAARVLENIARVRAALEATGKPGEVYYAIKANRFAPLLTTLAASGTCGVDVCSPAELQLAVDCGFDETRISFTGVGWSDADLDVLLRHPRARINCDSLSQIRRLGERAPGRCIGLRVNPGLGVGYGGNEKLRYAGARPTKFGVYPEDVGAALETAARYGLVIDGLHFHLGCGYLDRDLADFEAAVAVCAETLDRLPNVRHVNVGGGLGLPHVAGDAPLDLTAWASLLRRAFAGREVSLSVEPGDYIVKDAGVLALRVTDVEDKRGVRFVYVDGGFNLHPEPVFYDLPCEPAPCAPRLGATHETTIAGNINEAMDLWAVDKPLPPLEPGDWIAFLNAGGYGASMSSDHCRRGRFRERLLL